MSIQSKACSELWSLEFVVLFVAISSRSDNKSMQLPRTLGLVFQGKHHNTIFLLNSPQFVVPPQFYHKNWVIITGEKLPQPPPQLNFWKVNTTTTTKTPQNNFGGNQPLFVVLTIVQQSLRDTKLRKMVPYLNSHKITENLFIPLEIIIFMQIYGIFFHVTILKLKYLYKM